MVMFITSSALADFDYSKFSLIDLHKFHRRAQQTFHSVGNQYYIKNEIVIKVSEVFKSSKRLTIFTK